MSISGSRVTPETALNYTAYFSAILQISQTIGSCPFILFERKGRARVPKVAHPVHHLLTKMANPYMNSYLWKEIMQHHALSWGNGYSFIQRDSYGLPSALWPMLPGCMSVKVEDDGRPIYVYRNPKTHNEDRYEWHEIFHLAAFGFDGLQGLSLIGLFRAAIGLGLTEQEFTERFFSNGANMSGILTHPTQLAEEARKGLESSIAKKVGGLQNAGKFLVLQEAMTFTPWTMPLKDAQFLELKMYSVQEMARITNMPTTKLKDYTKLTYSNAEQLQIEYRTDTIRPWAERWEIAVDTQLLTPEKQKKTFAQFDLNAIVRGDMKTESEAFKNGRYGGWYSANDVLEKQGDNPLDDDKVGNMIWMPTNMMDASNPVVPASTPPGNSEGSGDE